MDVKKVELSCPTLYLLILSNRFPAVGIAVGQCIEDAESYPNITDLDSLRSSEGALNLI